MGRDRSVPLQVYAQKEAATAVVEEPKRRSRFVRNPDVPSVSESNYYLQTGDNINTASSGERRQSLRSAGQWSTQQWKKRQSKKVFSDGRTERNQPILYEKPMVSKHSTAGSPINYTKPYVPENGVEEEDEEEVYIVRQNYGYLAIIFSIVQTIILGLMMWQCGIAPVNLNPMIGPYPDALSEWGGKNSILILEDNHWWRMVTPILLHAGVIHLFCNISVQLDTGAFFEKEWGSVRWLIIYLTSAVGSSALSVIVMPQAISVGSSGAVMGLFGGKLAEVVMRMCERDDTEQEKLGHQVRKEQCVAVTCSVTVVMLFSFIPFVDWAAHLGGLVAGFAVGIMVFACEIQKCLFKILWCLIGTAISGAMFGLTLYYMYTAEIEVPEELRDVCGYYTENFEDYECNCMREEYLNNLNYNGQNE